MKANRKKRKRRLPGLAVLPMAAFTVFFVAIPLLYIAALSFLKRDVLWGVTNEFTLENYTRMLDPLYLGTFADSLELAFLTTAVTAAVGYPFGYFMARLPKKKKSLMILLVTVPFWTNALVRIYGWIILLRSGGPINGFLVGIGLIDAPIRFLYTYGAVLLGMVYSLLPFMILPVYSSAEKLDWSLVEAARDLGASKAKAFWTVAFPLTMPGVLSGVVLVFIPSVGLFFLSDLLGGGKIMLVGNLIKNQLLVARDWPFGAALSLVLMGMTALMIALYRKAAKARDLEGWF